jgi:LPS-assembly lipoprotein
LLVPNDHQKNKNQKRFYLLQGLLVVLLGVLTGCGFEPLYQTASHTSKFHEQLAAIKIEGIPDREGQILRNHLLDLLTPQGQPTHPRYRLAVALDIQKASMTLRRDGTTARYMVTLNATMTLKDAEGKKTLYQEILKVPNAYNMGDTSAASAYAATQAEKDAIEKALRLLAEDMTAVLGMYLRNRGEVS